MIFAQDKPTLLTVLAKMDGLSVAASVIAVIDVSVKVATLCSAYFKQVSNAPDEISDLTNRLTGLEKTLRRADQLIQSENGKLLAASRDLKDQLPKCFSTLQTLQIKLESGFHDKRKPKNFFRSLKWPFSRGEIGTIINTLGQYNELIKDALLLDNT